MNFSLTQPAQHRRAARKAGLSYVDDSAPGITRVGHGKTCTYRHASGKAVRDEATLRRIRHLVIPPAWTQVWICAKANGHIQTTGRDARGRKQYRYHSKWTETRDGQKYEHVISFGHALPKLRRQIKRDLGMKGLPRQKVLAAIVRLLETTLIRVGNDEYARENHSYGLTTMRNRHVRVRGKTMEFDFLGKSGKHHHIALADPHLAKIVRQCQDLPGQHLFAYRDEAGEIRAIGSQDVNDYLHEHTGKEFTAKDFRTWSGTVLAALAFQEFAGVTSSTQAKHNVRAVVESVSKILGNTPSVCRKCYIHPEIISHYLEGNTLKVVTQRIGEKLNGNASKLRPVEAAVLALLQKRLQTQRNFSTALLVPKKRRSVRVRR